MKVRYFEKRGAIWLDFRDQHGNRKRVPSGCTTQAEAERAAPRILAEQLAQATAASVRPHVPTSSTVPEAPSLTFRDAFKTGMKTLKGWLESNDPKTIELMQNRVEAYWGADTPLSKATHAAVLDWRAKLMKAPGKRAGTTLAPSTINHHLSHLTQLQKAAQMQPHGVDFLSVKGNERMRRVRDEELAKVEAWLVKAIEADKPRKGVHLMPFLIELGRLAPARKGELLGLRWADLYLEAEEPHAVLRKTKNRGNRELLLVDAAVGIMKRLRRMQPKDSLGPFDGLSYAQAGALWDDARAAVGLGDDPEFVFHVATRHEGLSRLGEKNASTHMLQAIGGHESINALKRYVKIDKSAARAFANAALAASRHGNHPAGGTDE